MKMQSVRLLILLQKVQAPVYGSKLTIALAKEHLKEMPAPSER